MDKILILFLQKQLEEGLALAADSDILELRPLAIGDAVPQHYIARFHCRTFVLAPDGQVVKADRADVGIHFPNHYLREANAYEVLTWLAPATVFHPNIRFPAICLGESFVRPGTTLTSMLYQIYAIVSWSKWAAHAPLNESAAQWARNHQDLFPSDPRPLKRRAVNVEVTLAAGKENS